MKNIIIVFIVVYIYLYIIFYYSFNFSENSKEFNQSKKNIVIVLSKGYRKSNLIAFFKTLKKRSPDSFLLIFSEKETILYAKEILSNEKVIGIELLHNYPYYPPNHYIYPIEVSILNKIIPLSITRSNNFFFHTIRFFLINAWLKEYGNEFNCILLCDVKDIIFQSDPFTYYNKSGLYFQQEIFIREGKKGIKADDLNYEWIKPYGPTKELLLNPIINSGQILGSSNEIKEFISEFCDFMKETHVNTAEQASLNFFIYSNKYKGNFISKVHGYGFALLLHYSLPRTKDNFTPANNYLYNFDGTIPPIIHAYYLGFSFGSFSRKLKYKEYIKYQRNL